MKRALFGVAMGVAMVAASANAQTAAPAAKPFSFGVSGGATVPTGDFGDAYKTGYNISALGEYRGPAWPVAVRLEAQFQHFGADGVADASIKSFGGLASVVYYVPSKGLVKPYVTGGVGFFHLTTDNGSVSDSQNKFGYDLGLGFNFQLTGFSTFVEGNWQGIQTEGSAAKMFPIRVGVRF
ncbi:MAG: outer membrane beta-barrel protein [Gemmatimonadaceae bacterium]|nr:outer membrane beta-barrel protein [Gemmatimonadaceae bacterium]